MSAYRRFVLPKRNFESAPSAIRAIPAIREAGNSKNSRNSNSADFENSVSTGVRSPTAIPGDPVVPDKKSHDRERNELESTNSTGPEFKTPTLAIRAIPAIRDGKSVHESQNRRNRKRVDSESEPVARLQPLWRRISPYGASLQLERYGDLPLDQAGHPVGHCPHCHGGRFWRSSEGPWCCDSCDPVGELEPGYWLFQRPMEAPHAD